MSARPLSLQARAAPLAWLRVRPQLHSDALAVAAALFFALCCNGAFWQAAIAQPWSQWRFALSLLLIVTALHAFLLGLVLNRWTAKPVVTLLFVTTAVAVHYMSAYGVFLDADMVRNVLHTDRNESRELLSVGLLPTLLAYGVLPTAVLWRVRLRPRPWRRALWQRSALLAGALAAGAAGLMLSFQDVSALVRNHRETRYLVTPANYLVSLASVLSAEPPGHRRAKLAVGTDARQPPRPAGARPRLVVLVLGETVRAQNWGLNGYARQTTPQLARRRDLINFAQVSACGTSTEVSVPCLFSPYGRRHYDEDAIRRQQSLLHVLERAGVATLWRDHQSGCKDVCEGLAFEQMANLPTPERIAAGVCDAARCYDEILLDGLDARLNRDQRDGRDRLVVLHELGNHGPAYGERAPAAFRRFAPTCDTSELGRCSRGQIVNSYDNAVLYTDHVLARAIALLQRRRDIDSALIYVSDHGESLGEKGLFLHGVPYAIAPREQTAVPMVMWLSPGFADAAGIDLRCLRRRAAAPTSQDALFSSLLTLLRVRTALYARDQDLFAGCSAA